MACKSRNVLFKGVFSERGRNSGHACSLVVDRHTDHFKRKVPSIFNASAGGAGGLRTPACGTDLPLTEGRRGLALDGGSVVAADANGPHLEYFPRPAEALCWRASDAHPCHPGKPNVLFISPNGTISMGSTKVKLASC